MGTDGRRPTSALRTGGDAARLDDWCDALSASGRGGRKSGGEWVGPCPRCGGQDRFAVKRGRDVEVVAHCRKGCSFHELRQAVFGGARLPASPCWQQEGRKTARSAYPDLDPNSLDPAGLARALVERLVLTPDWRKSLSRRGLDPNRLAAYGWRSVDSADGWQPLAELPARFGWPPWPSGRPRWPLGLDCGSALFVPLRDRLRDLSGLRFRGGQEWSEDRKARGVKAPKSVGFASVPSQRTPWQRRRPAGWCTSPRARSTRSLYASTKQRPWVSLVLRCGSRAGLNGSASGDPGAWQSGSTATRPETPRAESSVTGSRASRSIGSPELRPEM